MKLRIIEDYDEFIHINITIDSVTPDGENIQYEYDHSLCADTHRILKCTESIIKIMLTCPLDEVAQIVDAFKSNLSEITINLNINDDYEYQCYGFEIYKNNFILESYNDIILSFHREEYDDE